MTQEIIDKVNLALNPFTDKTGSKEPEKEEKAEIEKDETLKQTILQYRDSILVKDHDAANEMFSKLEVEVLNPASIDLFLQDIIGDFPEDILHHYVALMFLTRLIRKSYDSGYNNFVLSVQDKRLVEFA